MKQLSKFAIRAEERTFVLSLQDDQGQQIEMEASPEQVDAVIEALDDLLVGHDDMAPDFDPPKEIYQKPLG